jgi:E3 ubiquitin-protein ligase DOA10
MTELYVQTVENPLSKTARNKQFLGALMVIIGICSIGLAIGVSYYFFILTGVLLAIGIYLTISFNKTIKSFEYGINHVRIVFSVTTVISRTERKLEILLQDVVEYDDFLDLTIDGDFIMCSNVNENGVKALVFNVEGKTERVLFNPDEYLNAFLKDALPKEVTTKNVELNI